MTANVLFNPSFQTAAESITGFAARHDVLDDLLTVLRRPWRDANPHTLVIGPRGSGKSTLMRRVVAELETHPELAAAWEPVVLPEEPYEVGSLGELWLEALRRLAESQADAALLRLHADLRRDRDDDRIARVALDALRTWSTEHARRLLLIVENLDMLFDSALNPTTEWALRKVLQAEPFVLLFATAVRRFEGLDAHDRAFYEAFHRIDLAPLTPDEIGAVWKATTGRRPPLTRCQAVRVLTGGNPRMVRLLASLADGTSLHGVLGELTALIDRHTDYFKGNIEALSGNQRRVFLALAALWRPATSSQVAAEARLAPNLVSSELNRLSITGRIEVVPRAGRAKLYQVSERLYNIYYLLRRGGPSDARVRALVDFIAVFYAPEELTPLVGRLREEYGQAPDKHAACVEVVKALYSQRKDAASRQALLAAVDGPLLDAMPYTRRSVRQDPAAVLALLRGAMGDEALPDALACLKQHIGKVEPALADLAEEVLHRPGDDVGTAAIALIANDAPRARAMWRSLRDLERRDHLLLMSAIFALLMGDASEARAWLDAGPCPAPADAQDADARTLLHLVADPAHPTALADSLQISPDLADETVAYVIDRAGPAHAATVLAAASAPPPVVRAALALALALDARPADAHTVAAALHADHPSAAAAYAAAAYAWLAGDAASAQRYVHASLALAERPDALALAVLVTTDPVERARLRSRAGARLLSLAKDPAGWWLASVAPADDVARAWASTADNRRAELLAPMLRGALASDLPDVWRAALQLLPPDPGPSARVYATRLWGRAGRPDEAAAQLTELLALDDAGTQGLPSLVDLSLSLAAAGLADRVVAAITASAHADAFGPLLIGLGDATRAAEASPEELAIAEDVQQRLEALRASADIWRTPGHPTVSLPPLSEFNAVPTERGRRKGKRRARGRDGDGTLAR
jgi:hypothetical protein